MRRIILLPILSLTLALVACSTKTSTVMPPASATVTNGQVEALPSPVSGSTDTPVSSTSTPPTSPPLPVLASPALTRIYFQDEYNGWGSAVNGNGYVVRTVDGGRTWLNATPPGTGTIGYSATLTVLNANAVWVLVPEANFFSGTLYRTSDGGITWSSALVPFGGAIIQFQNGSTGRALATREARDGSEAVELFQTADGGVTWASVFHNDSSQPGASDSPPLEGIKNGMTFLDANTGWVTGSIPENGKVYLYVTHDGGVSWSQQSLPLPAGYADYRYLPQAPVFFGKDGFLPLIIYLPDQTDLTFYSTHDGGLSWSGDPTDVHKVIKPGLSAFGDPLHIWSWDGATTLYATSDGAQMWEGVPASMDLNGRLSQLEFVPDSTGHFTGWALTRVDEDGHSQLYRTSDGSTWTRLIP